MKPYSKEVAEKIIGERICEFDVSDDGIRPRLVSVENAEFDQLINWSPLCELDDDDGPNPEIAPALPFPFAANHLAALMVHGGGYFVREQYGDWSDGPDPQSILKLGVQATKAKQALKRAFDAYRSAANIVGPCDTTYSEKIQQLEKQYGAWPDAQDARDKIEQVHREADAYEAAWRKKIVHQLLAVVVEPAPQAAPAQQAETVPAPVVTEPSMDSSTSIFRDMPGLTASELALAFVGDKPESGMGANNMLEVSARSQRRGIPLASLDLVNRRNGTPNGECGVLLGLTQGLLLKKSGPNTQKMKRLRNVFLHHFGIVKDPFEPYMAATGWVPFFKIVDRRGAADERAKKEVEERMVSFEQLAEQGIQLRDRSKDEADEWMKENGHRY